MFKPSDELAEAMNQQIGHELAASNQYIAIANYFSAETLPRMAEFFYRQADEEHEHAMKFVHFLLELGAQVEIPAIPAPSCRLESAEAAVAAALESEKKVTRQIDALVELAEKDGHKLAVTFLDWFVTEQLEEVNTMQSLLTVVRRAGEVGLFHVENYVARIEPHEEE